MQILGFPVLTGTTRQRLTYSYERSKEHQSFEYSFSDSEAAIHLRLGPIDPSWTSIDVEHSGKPATCRLVVSGDSNWLWTQVSSAMTGKIDIRPR